VYGTCPPLKVNNPFFHTGMECIICGGKEAKLIQSTRIQSFHEASKQHGDGFSEKLPEVELLP